jgi:putative DNA primase/helicase
MFELRPFFALVAKASPRGTGGAAMTSPLLRADVSIFASATHAAPTERRPLAEQLDRIKRGRYQPHIDQLRQLRTTQGADAYKQAKKRLEAFTPAGVFSHRANAHLMEASGLVHFDFDHPADLADAKARLTADPWVAYAFVSPSNDGIKVAVWADGIVDDRSYKHAWSTVLTYFTKYFPDLAVANDKACKDIARLCFVSHDPELYMNPDARLYAVPREDPAPSKPKPARTASRPRAQLQSTAASKQARVEDALHVIPADEYDTWLRVGMALHATGELWARPLWDTWSQRSTKYDPTRQEQTWAGFRPDGGTTIATVFHLAQQYGYHPPSPATLVVGGQTTPGSNGAPQAASADQEGTTASGQAVPQDTPGQQAPPPRPDIFLNTEMTRIIDETQAALRALPAAPVIYQRARHLAVIARGVRPPKWLHRPHDMPVILDASTARLTELASQAAAYWKKDKRRNKWEEALPPKWVIETLHSRAEWPFPLLEGIVASPTLRPDGSLLEVPGYDPQTGLYLDTNGTAFPPVPARPTLDDARTAIGHLQEPVIDFPFAERWHFSATLAGILSAVCRFAIMGNVPLFAIRANTRSSGKGLLADVISIIGTGRAAPRWPQVTEDEEERKRLFTVALAGYPVLHIDNVTRPLGSPALDMALTAPSFSDRILGKHESREAPLSMVWLASGNNMQFKGDTARRIVPIDLDPKMEKPEERTGFQHHPLTPWVQQERPRLTVAALTIIKAYFTAGCPPQSITPMGSFEEWSDLIRQALIWAGEDDPNEGRKNIEAESDPQYDRLAALLDTWAQCYPTNDARTLAQVKDDIQTRAALPAQPGNDWNVLQDALGAFDPKYNGTSLNNQVIGYEFRKFQRRTIAGRRFVSAGQVRRAQKWAIEHV